MGKTDILASALPRPPTTATTEVAKAVLNYIPSMRHKVQTKLGLSAFGDAVNAASAEASAARLGFINRKM